MSEDSFQPDRRRVLAGLAGGAAGATLLAACGNSEGLGTDGGNGSLTPAPTPPAGATLPDPSASGIEHVVVVMMENRSFDHYLGWVPGARGRQAGLRFPDKKGQMIDSFRLSQNPEYGYGGCGKEDPDHGYNGGRVHLNGGKLDGWLGTVGDANVDTDHFPIGYYTDEDLPFFKGVAENWTVCDHYFHGILASTYPNRIYMHSGETDRLSNGIDRSTLPTIWDRLAAKDVSGTYFFQDLPLTALWYEQHLDISQPFASFLAQAAAGQLPAVSYVEPRFVGENPGAPIDGVPVSTPGGISNDDHPVGDVRDGQAFLNSVYDALRSSPNWDKTLLIINYDEWGGFYDHVMPPTGPVSDAERDLGNDGRLGFRVPCVIIGPRAKQGVCSLPFDPQSILNFICWNFGLDPIGSRADWSLNLAYALDFTSAPRTDAPAFEVAAGPFGTLCTNTALDGLIPRFPAVPQSMATRPSESHFGEWLVLRELARRQGFKV